MPIIIGGVLGVVHGSKSMEAAAKTFPSRVQSKPAEPQLAKMLPPLQQVGGTCYAYAVARLCELAGFESPSPAWINYHSLALDAHTEKVTLRQEGSYASSAIASILYYGVCMASDMPDTSSDKRMPPNVIARLRAFDNMRSWAASPGLSAPCVITSFVYGNVFDYVHGVSDPLDEDANGSIGSHVWVYLGRDKTGQHVVQSSWGAWGGPDGIAYVTEDYLNASWDRWSLARKK